MRYEAPRRTTISNVVSMETCKCDASADSSFDMVDSLAAQTSQVQSSWGFVVVLFVMGRCLGNANAGDGESGHPPIAAGRDRNDAAPDSPGRAKCPDGLGDVSRTHLNCQHRTTPHNTLPSLYPRSFFHHRIARHAPQLATIMTNAAGLFVHFPLG
jgi:hypothetical protein